MPEVKIKYTIFEPKKNSVRMKTEERLDQQYPLPDIYVPRSVLRQLGLLDRAQDSSDLTLNVTYTTN